MSHLNPQLNISSNVNSVVALDNVPQTIIPVDATTTLRMNENQSLEPDCVQATTPNHASQPMQDYQILAHPQKTVVISENSFFYTPCNDFQMYHIICEEIPLSFELVSHLINSTDRTPDNYN